LIAKGRKEERIDVQRKNEKNFKNKKLEFLKKKVGEKKF